MTCLHISAVASEGNEKGWRSLAYSVSPHRSDLHIDRSAEVVTRVKKEELSVYDVMGKLTVESRHRLAEAKRLISNQTILLFEVKRRD